MREIEITELPPLDEDQARIIDLHSMMNILNVVVGELTLLGFISDDLSARLEPPQRELATIEKGLRGAGSLLCWLDRLEGLEPAIDTILAGSEEGLEAGDRDALAEARENLRGIFAVLAVRLRELRARLDRPEGRVDMPVEQLRRDFLEVFAAIEKNAKGRYWFRYNLAEHGAQDYYINLDFNSELGEHFSMPGVLQDVLRDLCLNARKYTRPGGRVMLAVHQGPTMLRAVIEDTGRGIPDDELEKVAAFGYRASNVTEVRTMGGGFGLTKAVHRVKALGGRLWIASELERGTRIRLQVPIPAADAG